MGIRALEIWQMDSAREKILLRGEENLSDYELLTFLLEGNGKVEEASAAAAAQTLLNKYKDLASLRQASLADLVSVPGLSLSISCILAAAFELGARAQQPRTSRFVVTDSQSVYNFYAPRLCHLSYERFHVMCLDAKYSLIRDAFAGIGGAAECTVIPRDALAEAVRVQSYAVLFVHNHPSGDPTPSTSDYCVTRRLKNACDILGIKALDHIILGNSCWKSMADANEFQNL